jgi:hypothetical protein
VASSSRCARQCGVGRNAPPQIGRARCSGLTSGGGPADDRAREKEGTTGPHVPRRPPASRGSNATTRCCRSPQPISSPQTNSLRRFEPRVRITTFKDLPTVDPMTHEKREGRCGDSRPSRSGGSGALSPSATSPLLSVCARLEPSSRKRAEAAGSSASAPALTGVREEDVP